MEYIPLKDKLEQAKTLHEEVGEYKSVLEKLVEADEVWKSFSKKEGFPIFLENASSEIIGNPELGIVGQYGTVDEKIQPCRLALLYLDNPRTLKKVENKAIFEHDNKGGIVVTKLYNLFAGIRDVQPVLERHGTSLEAYYDAIFWPRPTIQ